jgi:hypothetical protein
MKQTRNQLDNTQTWNQFRSLTSWDSVLWIMMILTAGAQLWILWQIMWNKD